METYLIKFSLGLGLSLFFLGTGCANIKNQSGSNDETVTRSAGARTPASFSYAHPEWLPQNLEPGEAWVGGSREKELEAFVEDAHSIETFQTEISRLAHLENRPRVFHDKQNACMIGTLTLKNAYNDIGLFSGSPEVTHNVLVRFSNGLPLDLPDVLPDFRGMSVKIFGITDEATSEVKVVDLTSFNAPTGIGSTQRDTVNFLTAFMTPKKLVQFMYENRATAQKLIEYSIPFYSSMTKVKYHSAHAYRLKAGVAMHYMFVPAEGEESYKTVWKDAVDFSPRWLVEAWWSKNLDQLSDHARALKPNYLSVDMAKKSAQKTITFNVYLQEWTHGRPPLEDNMVVWSNENSKSYQVGQIVLPRQDTMDPELSEICHSTRFTPGHQVSQNRPLSTMGRGRTFTYFASAQGRGAAAKEPSELDLARLQTKVFLK